MIASLEKSKKGSESKAWKKSLKVMFPQREKKSNNENSWVIMDSIIYIHMMEQRICFYKTPEAI